MSDEDEAEQVFGQQLVGSKAGEEPMQLTESENETNSSISI